MRDYVLLNSTSSIVSGSFVTQYVAGYAMTLTRITISHISAPFGSTTYTVRVNGSNTTLAVTSSTAGTSSATGSVSVAMGNLISVLATGSGGSVVLVALSL